MSSVRAIDSADFHDSSGRIDRTELNGEGVGECSVGVRSLTVEGVADVSEDDTITGSSHLNLSGTGAERNAGRASPHCQGSVGIRDNRKKERGDDLRALDLPKYF